MLAHLKMLSVNRKYTTIMGAVFRTQYFRIWNKARIFQNQIENINKTEIADNRILIPTCCVAEVDVVRRFLSKTTWILNGDMDIGQYPLDMVWKMCDLVRFVIYMGNGDNIIFTWMKTGPEVSLEACPLWNRRRAKSRCLVPPPSCPPPPPPSWRGASALPPAPILMLLDHFLVDLGEGKG